MSVYEFYWERAGDGVRLLRAHGSAEEAVLPEQIAGLPLREIGPYCFAGSCHLPEHYERITVRERVCTNYPDGGLRRCLFRILSDGPEIWRL